MIRILIYPNITYPRDITKDSYVQFIRKFLMSMKMKREDIFWYCVIPKYEGKQYKQTEALKRLISFPNLKFIEVEIPRAPFNRIHFDYNDLKKKIDWRNYSIDLVFNNLPEMNQNLKVLLFDETNIQPQFFGYSHWFDIQKQVSHQSSFLPNMFGVLQMDKCYLNTQSQKDMVMKEAKRTFNKDVLDQLDQKLEVFPIPIMASDIRTLRSDKDFDKRFDQQQKMVIGLRHKRNKEDEIFMGYKKKGYFKRKKEIIKKGKFLKMDSTWSNLNYSYVENVIVFNHRPSAEKSFKEFVATMDYLWDENPQLSHNKKLANRSYKGFKRFKVWIPLLKTKLEREWLIEMPCSTKKEYYDSLRQCTVGVSPKQKYGGWSISTTDGLMCGVPYIMYDADYYKELNPTANFYKTRDELIKYLKLYIGDPDEDNYGQHWRVHYRDTMVDKSLEHISNHLIFDDNIDVFSDQIDTMMKSVKKVGGNRVKDFIKFIKKKGEVSHRDLLKEFGWGRAMKFNTYRKRILTTKGITEVPNKWKTIYQYKKD